MLLQLAKKRYNQKLTSDDDIFVGFSSTRELVLDEIQLLALVLHRTISLMACLWDAWVTSRHSCRSASHASNIHSSSSSRYFRSKEQPSTFSRHLTSSLNSKYPAPEGNLKRTVSVPAVAFTVIADVVSQISGQILFWEMPTTPDDGELQSLIPCAWDEAYCGESRAHKCGWSVISFSSSWPPSPNM